MNIYLSRRLVGRVRIYNVRGMKPSERRRVANWLRRLGTRLAEYGAPPGQPHIKGELYFQGEPALFEEPLP